MSNIVETITANRNLVALARGIRDAGLEEMLSVKGPFTVFGPSDLAFGKLQTGSWRELLMGENKSRLIDFMHNCIIEGKTIFGEFTDGQKLKTLGGNELTVKVKDGDVDIDGARIQGKDMDASNGMVYSMDKVAAFIRQ